MSWAEHNGKETEMARDQIRGKQERNWNVYAVQHPENYRRLSEHKLRDIWGPLIGTVNSLLFIIAISWS